MAVSYIGSTSASANNPTSGSFSLPANWQAGDVALAWWYARANTKTLTAPSGFTQILQNAVANYGCWWLGLRVLQAGDSTFSWTSASVSNATTCYGLIVLRGASTTSSDYAPVAATGTTQDPNPPSATVYANGIAIAFYGQPDDNTSTFVLPSGYTLAWNQTQTAGTDAGAGAAYKLISANGTEDPGIFDTASTVNYWVAVTLAAKPVVTTPVSQTLAPSYVIRSKVAATASPSYVIRQAVARALAPSYSILASSVPVSQTLTATYAVRTTISRTVAPSYAVRAMVAKGLATSYAIRSTVTRSMGAAYSIRATAAKAVSLAYAIRTTAIETLAGSYTLRTAVARSIYATYTVDATVVASLSPAYTIISQTAAVAQTLTAGYSIPANVAGTLGSGYAIFAKSSSTLSASYEVEGTVPAYALGGAYLGPSRRARQTFSVTTSYTTSYELREHAAAELAVNYTVPQLARATLDARYSILWPVVEALLAGYTVNSTESVRDERYIMRLMTLDPDLALYALRAKTGEKRSARADCDDIPATVVTEALP